jgi:hypothetical protein
MNVQAREVVNQMGVRIINEVRFIIGQRDVRMALLARYW